MKKIKLITLIAATAFTGAIAQGMQTPSNTPDDMQQYKMHRGGKMFGNHHRNFKRNRRLARVFRKLNLTPEQRTKIKEARKEMRQGLRQKRQQFRGSMGLKNYINVDGFDKQGFIQMGTLRSKEMLKNRADMIDKMIKILTPEQRLILIQELKRHKNKKHQPK